MFDEDFQDVQPTASVDIDPIPNADMPAPPIIDPQPLAPSTSNRFSSISSDEFINQQENKNTLVDWPDNIYYYHMPYHLPPTTARTSGHHNMNC